MGFNQIWRYLQRWCVRHISMLRMRRIATPLRLQGMAAECGVVALAILMAHHGRDIPLDTLRRRICSPLAGSTLRQLRETAREEGFCANARRIDLDGLSSLSLPVLVHLRFLHFAVLEAVSASGVRLNDPAEGIVHVEMREFSRQFTGIVLTLAPAEPASGVRRSAWPSRETLRAACSLPAMLIAAGVVATSPFLAAGEVGFAFLAILLLLAGDALAMRRTRLAARSRAEAEAVRLEQQVQRWPAADMLLSGRYRLDAMLSAIATVADPRPQRSAIFLPALVASMLVPPFVAGLAGLAQSVVLFTTVLLFFNASTLRERSPGARSDLEAEPGPLPAMLFEPRARWRLGTGPQTMFIRLSGLAAAGDKRLVTAVQESQRRSVLFFAVVVASLVPVTYGNGEGLIALFWCGLMTAFLSMRLIESLASGHVTEAAHARLADVPPPEPAVPRPPATPVAPSSVHGPERPIALEYLDVSWAPFQRAETVFGPVNLRVPVGDMLAVEGPSGSGHSVFCRLSAGLFAPSEGQVLVFGERCSGPRPGVILLDGDEPMPRGSVRGFLSAGSDADKDRVLDLVELTATLSPRGGLDLYLSAGAPQLSGGQKARLRLARALLARPALLVIDGLLDSVEPELAERILMRLRRSGLTLLVSSLRPLPADLTSHRLYLGSEMVPP